MKVVWLKRARKDLNDAINWLNQHNPTVAKKTARLINLQVNQLNIYPQLGRVGDIDGSRELVIQQTRYIAVYQIDTYTNQIKILALMHESMQWPEEF
jgi:toxin ParE1/3/4